jgi:hypothetical protein
MIPKKRARASTKDFPPDFADKGLFSKSPGGLDKRARALAN